MGILVTEDDEIRRGMLDFAEQLILSWVDESSSNDLYGETFPVYNVHGLKHIVDDARYFDCSLDDISCFPVENSFIKLKHYIKNGRNVLASVTKRMFECGSLALTPVLRKPKKFKYLKRDCWFYDPFTKEFVCVTKASNPAKTRFDCKSIHLDALGQLYGPEDGTSPYSSKDFNIGVVADADLDALQTFSLTKDYFISTCDRAMGLKLNNTQIALIPLHHSVQSEMY